MVTGGTGFIGAAVCRCLLGCGVKVLAVRKSTTASPARPSLDWFQCDLAAEESRLEPGDIAGIVHTAARLPEDLTSSDQEAKTNRAIDTNVFSLVRERRVPLVYASSTAVYGVHSTGSSSKAESDALNPCGAYAREKVWAEEWGRQIMAETGTPFTSLRICAPYGPAQKRSTVMNIFLRRALEQKPLFFHGSGSREQSFTFIEDIARAFSLALRGGGGTYNIATALPITMRALAELVADRADLDQSMVRSSGKNDSQEGVKARFDIGAAERTLGWRPEVSLSEGIDRSLDFMRREVSG